jgi:excisionase family DNA binding protein
MRANVTSDRESQKMSEPTAVPAKRYGTIPQAATYTGLSEKSIRRMISRGRLVGYRPVSGRILIDYRELDAAIKATANNPSGRGQALHREECAEE